MLHLSCANRSRYPYHRYVWQLRCCCGVVTMWHVSFSLDCKLYCFICSCDQSTLQILTQEKFSLSQVAPYMPLLCARQRTRTTNYRNGFGKPLKIPLKTSTIFFQLAVQEKPSCSDRIIIHVIKPMAETYRFMARLMTSLDGGRSMMMIKLLKLLCVPAELLTQLVSLKVPSSVCWIKIKADRSIRNGCLLRR